MFNFENTEWRDGATNLILGQPPAFLDSINRRHPKLFSLYKHQKQDDWQEDDVNLKQAIADFKSCPEELTGPMLDNLLYQWELDSVAANSMTYLLAPFITDSDLKLSVTKNGEIECLHALTYSEIIRVVVENPLEVMSKAFNWDCIKDRSKTILLLLDQLKEAGARYILGERDNDQALYNIAFKGLVTFYCLERLQFMASFSQTFALVETGNFQPVGELVKKIMKDEYKYHCRTMEYAIKHEMSTKRGGVAYMEVREELEDILAEVVQREYDWNEVMFSKYNVPNMTLTQANLGVQYHAQEVYNTLYIVPPFKQQGVNPLKFMDKYLTLDFFQNANQESDNSNYSLNSYHKDLEETTLFNRY